MFWQNLEFNQKVILKKEEEKGQTRHVPVLFQEVLTALACKSNQNFVDFTLGGGGHSEAILRATSPNGKLVGVDRDLAAIERATRRLQTFGERFVTRHADLKEAGDVLDSITSYPVHGALVDCGVSSDQLETAERGFSFQNEGPLDMRMDPSQGFSAEEWLHSAREKEIADVLYEFAEEKFSRRIAKAIVEARQEKRLKTTRDLAEICRFAVPAHVRYGKIHPATRTFQAIRILVNDELNQIRIGLLSILSKLPMGARLAVITFHSLEDRIVKELFKEAKVNGFVRLLSKKPIIATDEEQRENPRSRSAKLRSLEIIRGQA